MYNCSLIFDNYIHLQDEFSSQCLCRRITDLTSPYTDTTEKRCMDMAETSKKHDTRHNARNAA